MLLDKLVELYKDRFEYEITESTDVVENNEGSKEIEIFSTFRTSALEILEDDPEAFKEIKLEWATRLFGESLEYVGSISQIWQNENRFKDLVRDLKDGEITPFVGSGMSVDSGFLEWGKFLRKLRRFSSVTEARFDKLISESKYDELADEICAGMDESTTTEVMRAEFLIRPEELKDRIRGAVQFLPYLFSGSILTTNYDNVIESVYDGFGIRFEKLLGIRIEDYKPMSLSATRFLLKLHGDLFLPKSRVLTKPEYDLVYADGAEYREVLCDIYASKQLLFLGCSLGPDRTMEVFRTVGNIFRQHYAFMPIRINSDDIDEIHAHIKTREDELRNLGIYAIWYKGDPSVALNHLLLALLSHKGVD